MTFLTILFILACLAMTVYGAVFAIGFILWVAKVGAVIFFAAIICKLLYDTFW